MVDQLLTRFNFEVILVPSGLSGDEGLTRGARGAFSRVTGLEIELQRSSFREGGYHLGERQLVGGATQPELVLHRGLSLDPAFWTWIQSCVAGSYPLPYVQGRILVHGPRGAAGESSARWSFRNAIATRVRASELDAISGAEVPIEELHIAHEGLERIAS